MTTEEKNKQFLKNYFREMRHAQLQGPESFQSTVHRFIADQKLIDHIKFFQSTFPGYTIVAKEMMAEGDKVLLKVDFIGTHKGSTENIPSTEKKVEVPFALCYTIKDEKIIDFWALANEIDFFEQLGLSSNQVNVSQPIEIKEEQD